MSEPYEILTPVRSESARIYDADGRVILYVNVCGEVFDVHRRIAIEVVEAINQRMSPDE